MSVRRAQDERIEGTPDGLNAITEISDVPDAPTIGTATAGVESATVAYTAAATGGAVTTFTATSTPGSFTGTGSSPITVSGLTGGTSYTFTVTGSNSTGSAVSAASNSVTPTVLNGYYLLDSYEFPNSSATSITFSNIPQKYKVLRIIGTGKSTRTNADSAGAQFQFNSDTGNNYEDYVIYGQGGSFQTDITNSYDRIYTEICFGSAQNNQFGGFITDIIDYTNTTKYKTVKSLSSYGKSNGWIALCGGTWRSTAAINTIKVMISASADGNFAQYSQVSIYGIV